MTYFVSLRMTAIVLGVIYIAAHLPAALAPGAFTAWSLRFSYLRVLRRKWTGVNVPVELSPRPAAEYVQTLEPVIRRGGIDEKPEDNQDQP